MDIGAIRQVRAVVQFHAVVPLTYVNNFFFGKAQRALTPTLKMTNLRNYN
jgi:hypothetical protein